MYLTEAFSFQMPHTFARMNPLIRCEVGLPINLPHVPLKINKYMIGQNQRRI